MADSIFQRSFAGGELAPALHARADTVKYATGLRTCRNCLVLKEGGIANRPGFYFIDAIKTESVDSTFLFPYYGDTTDSSLLIEAGTGYLRFFKNGGRLGITGVPAYAGGTTYQIGDVVASGGVNYYAKQVTTGNAPPNATYWYAMPAGIYEIPHPFGAHRFAWSQDGHVLTLTQQDTPPQELTYISDTHWVLTPLVTTPWHAAPVNPTLTPGVPGPSGGHTYAYVITAARAETFEETDASAPVSAAGIGVPTETTPNVVGWDAVAGAAEYYVYLDPYGNGVYGLVGTAKTNSFRDVGFVADFTVTPPVSRTPFTGATNYPAVSATHQQRRLLASTALVPDGVWGSRIGFPSNFGVSSPLQDDDAITFRITGSGPVRWIVPLKQLIVLTDKGEWTVGEPKQPLTPESIPADQEVYVGASDKMPVVVGNAILYLQARASILRELRFDRQVEGWNGKDLTVFSSHLFKGYTFFRLAYQQTPDSVVWAVRSDGTLLGLTYVPDEDLWGWHRHDTLNGSIEDVCVVPEGDEDAVYVIVKRTFGATVRRFIERLSSRAILDWDEDVFFVDAGLTYQGPPASHISGLDHLNGQVVAVVGDGAVIFNGDPTAAQAASFTVAGGAITLPDAYEVVHVGLPIRYGEIELLDLDVQGSSIRDKKKRVGGVTLLVDKSSRGFWAGPDADSLRQFTPESFDPTDDAFTGSVFLNVTATYNETGRVLIRQTDPLPLTILGVLPLVELGG